MSIYNLITGLPQYSDTFSFGFDIDEIHKNIFSLKNKDIEVCFRLWASKFQPCAFGKLASKKTKCLDYHITIITEEELKLDDYHLFQIIQNERRNFKDRALQGEVSAHLIFFVSRHLTYAKPSSEFLKVQQELCSFYLPEALPIKPDIIYSESIPLRHLDNSIKAYKAGINTFYSTAHLTRNHDRRVPGGFLISINAPGHYLHLSKENGVYSSLEEGLQQIKNLTIQSIGKGGISHHEKISTTWLSENPVNQQGCPLQKGEHSDYYSGFYHTDVLIPSEITIDNKELKVFDTNDRLIFDWNVLFYVTQNVFPLGHPYHGEFVGVTISEEEIYFNSFAPRKANTGKMID